MARQALARVIAAVVPGPRVCLRCHVPMHVLNSMSSGAASRHHDAAALDPCLPLHNTVSLKSQVFGTFGLGE